MLLEVSYGRLAASKVTLSVTWVSGFGGIVSDLGFM